MGFRMERSSFSLGQALSQTDRDHYLVAVGRALLEASQIDKWLQDHPDARLRPVKGGSETDSPYYVKWFNYQPHRESIQALKDRLSSEDPTTWGSLTQDEHGTFGWVSVIDQVYSAFQADPLNLTAGRWQDGIRLSDEIPAVTPPPPSTGLTTPVLIGIGVVGAIGLMVLATR